MAAAPSAPSPPPNPPPAARPPAPVICPECGTPATSPAKPIARRRANIWIPRLTILLALIALAIVAVRTSSTSVIGPSTTEPLYDFVRVTRLSPAELQRMAEGNGDGSLTRLAALATIPARRDSRVPAAAPTLFAQVQPKSGTARTWCTFGWPVDWISIDDWAAFADPDARTGPFAFTYTSGGTFDYWWLGSFVISETAGTMATHHHQVLWQVKDTILTILLIIAAGWLGRVLLAPLLRRARDQQTARRNARRFGLLSALACILIMLAAATIFQRTPVTWIERHALSGPTIDNVPVNLDWTQKEIAALTPGPASDAAIARRIIERGGSSIKEGTLIALTYSAVPRTPTRTSWAIGPWGGLWASFWRGQPQLLRPSESWYGSLQPQWCYCEWRQGSESYGANIALVELAPIALLILLLYLLAKLLTFRLVLRVTLRRQRRNLCQQCAYPLPTINAHK